MSAKGLFAPASVLPSVFPARSVLPLVCSRNLVRRTGYLFIIAVIFSAFDSKAAAGITEYPLVAGRHPARIASGPDGALWFTERGTNKIGRITVAGNVTEFFLSAKPLAIVSGPDGALWFTEDQADGIGRITTTGVVTEFPLTVGSNPTGIVSGPDGNLWFTEFLRGMIGRITPAGQITEYSILSSSSGPNDITVGPDGNLWFTESNTSNIGRITTGGTLAEFSFSITATTNFITQGSDGNLWFSQLNFPTSENIGIITPTGTRSNTLSQGQFFPAVRLTTGPDGNIWFTQMGANVLGRLAVVQNSYAHPDTTTNFLVPTANSEPGDITVGPDTNLWFTESAADKIGTLPAPQVGAEQDRIDPFPATEGTSASGNLAFVLDANGVPPSNFTASIDWGDATTSSGTISGSAPQFIVTGSHTYLTANQYPVTVQVVDTQDALTMVVYTAVTVFDAPLAAGTTPNLTAVQGIPINKVMGSFTDADPNAIASYYNLFVRWPGDDVPHPCTDCLVLPKTSTGIFNVTSSHVFTTSGTLQFRIDIFDAISRADEATTTIGGFVAVAPAPGFLVSATAPSPASVSTGGSATSTITISPITGYSGSVTLACSSITLNGLTVSDPPVCAFNPPSVSGASGNSVLTVSTKAPVSSRLSPDGNRSGPFFATLLLLLGITLQTGFASHRSKLLGVVLMCVMLSGLILLLGCGGGNSGGTRTGTGGTPTGTYAIVVTGSANGVISQNVKLTLTVQ